MCGKVTVITGPMKSSKTLKLILEAKEAVLAKKNVVAYHPEISSRWSKNEIVTRLTDESFTENQTLSFPSTPLNFLGDFFRNLPPDTDIVIFDDAQFFNSAIVSVVHSLRRKGIDVIISGLDMTSFLQPFGPMPQLMAIADKVIKATAVCEECQEPAQTSYRLVKNTDEILVGDKEYKALCYRCWYEYKDEEK